MDVSSPTMHLTFASRSTRSRTSGVGARRGGRDGGSSGGVGGSPEAMDLSSFR
jgi:hypothetical protein